MAKRARLSVAVKTLTIALIFLAVFAKWILTTPYVENYRIVRWLNSYDFRSLENGESRSYRTPLHEYYYRHRSSLPMFSQRETMSDWLAHGSKFRHLEPLLCALLIRRDTRVDLGQVCFVLGMVGKDSLTWKTLIDSLGSEDSRVRIYSIGALARLHELTALEPLSQLAITDGDEVIRANACYALGELGGEKATAVLRLAIEDKSKLVRDAAATALSKGKSSKSRGLFQYMLADA